MSRSGLAFIVVLACADFTGLAVAQAPEPRLFTWGILGARTAEREIEVIITPTRFGQVQGIKVKAVELMPLPTADDPRPRHIAPNRTDTTPLTDALRAWFTKPRGRFHLHVTLSDGTTHEIDIYARPPAIEQKISIPRPSPGVRWWASARSRIPLAA